jgi:S1-C subfamily serine protease
MIWRSGLMMCAAMLAASCVHPDLEIKPMPVPALEKLVNNCRTMAVSLPPADAAMMIKRGEPSSKDKTEMFVGGAVPVSARGYFMTAHHVVMARKGNDLVLMYMGPQGQKTGLARIVWMDKKHDLALLKAPFETPAYYHWSPRDRDLPEGTPIMHAGMKTGGKGEVGHLSQRVSGTGKAPFEHTLHLEQGDSGGPVFLPSGELLGINSAIGIFSALDTNFFDSAQSSRPDPAVIERLIAKDSHGS